MHVTVGIFDQSWLMSNNFSSSTF